MRSLEQFLVTECFSNLFQLDQLKFKLEKNIGIYKYAGKVRKILLIIFTKLISTFIFIGAAHYKEKENSKIHEFLNQSRVLFLYLLVLVFSNQ